MVLDNRSAGIEGQVMRRYQSLIANLERFHAPKSEVDVSFLSTAWREGGVFVTALDTVTSLELERGVFDSDEARILSVAFEKAWTYVQFGSLLGVLEAWERQSELARCLMVLLKPGDNTRFPSRIRG
jgi:hypothetical protein